VPELLLFGGLAILGGLLLLGYLFVNADPAKLARNLIRAAMVGAVLAFLGFIATEQVALLLSAVALAAPASGRLRALLRGAGSRSASGRAASEIATRTLRMSLDHETGTMTGTVLTGRFAGLRLEELGTPDLLHLLRECRAEDEEGARLLEAYLDRTQPKWRDELGGAEAGEGNQSPRGSTQDVTVDEAYAILGLAPGADAAAIKAAHHRLMMQLHPDHGGTDYLATKINRARDVLLKR